MMTFDILISYDLFWKIVWIKKLDRLKICLLWRINFDYIILPDCEGFLNCWFLIFSFSWLDILIVECFLEFGVWAANCRLWSVELLRESQCFLVECRIVERTCRSLGRLKDVELWRGKNLQKPLVDLRM